ncbi:Cfap97d1, partial [Symbiodinium microadriaticum]
EQQEDRDDDDDDDEEEEEECEVQVSLPASQLRLRHAKAADNTLPPWCLELLVFVIMDKAIPCGSKICTKRIKDREQQLHRERVRNMKSQVDTGMPTVAQLDHVKVNLKKEQMMEDRYTEIDRDNRILLKKMTDIMKQQTTFPPTGERKSGPSSLNKDARKKELIRITRENQCILKRIQQAQPVYNHVEWEDQHRRNVTYLKNRCEFPVVLRTPRRERYASSELVHLGEEEAGDMTSRSAPSTSRGPQKDVLQDFADGTNQKYVLKVIDDFLSDAEAQAVITDLEAQSGSERVRQEAPVLAQRLKSELRSPEQEAQLSSAVEVLEPVGRSAKLIHEVSGHAALEKRLRETMTGKEAAQLEASKSSVPVSRKSGDVQEHADHVTHWVNGKVPGTAAVAYLESAPDGGSLGKLIFKDVADEQKVVKEVDAIAKRFISWDNSKCLHSFKARYQGTRRLLGPLALTSYGDMVKVGIITQPTTTTTEAPEATTTEEPEAPKSYYGSWKKKWWSWKKGYSGYPQPSANLIQDGSSDTVHFMQIDKNGSHKEL